eukprot:scaffold15028_cov100-Isochrysis_galbana.AAC.2
MDRCVVSGSYVHTCTWGMGVWARCRDAAAGGDSLAHAYLNFPPPPCGLAAGAQRSATPTPNPNPNG